MIRYHVAIPWGNYATAIPLVDLASACSFAAALGKKLDRSSCGRCNLTTYLDFLLNMNINDFGGCAIVPAGSPNPASIRLHQRNLPVLERADEVPMGEIWLYEARASLDTKRWYESGAIPDSRPCLILYVNGAVDPDDGRKVCADA